MGVPLAVLIFWLSRRSQSDFVADYVLSPVPAFGERIVGEPVGESTNDNERQRTTTDDDEQQETWRTLTNGGDREESPKRSDIQFVEREVSRSFADVRCCSLSFVANKNRVNRCDLRRGREGVRWFLPGHESHRSESEEFLRSREMIPG